MSAESKFNRDKEGFLKCKDCPRRFQTEIGFENHSSFQHKKDIATELCQTIEDDSSLQQSAVAKLNPYQCLECKKSFSLNGNLKFHIKTVHK